MKVEIFGIQPTNKEKRNVQKFERNEIYFKAKMSIDVQERETDVLITFEVTDTVFQPQKGISFEMQSKTGFQISSDSSLEFLKSATNDKTLDLCVELGQVASAHNRMFMILESQDEVELEQPVNVPFIYGDEYREIIKNCLLSTLN
jgi:hypothetical protein